MTLPAPTLHDHPLRSSCGKPRNRTPAFPGRVDTPCITLPTTVGLSLGESLWLRELTRSPPSGLTRLQQLCCLMTSESLGCHDISRHRLGASARWESCCFDLSEVVSRSLWWLPASPGCTARGWGATGGGLGVLVVGGTFVQYAQPFASGSRPSFSRPTRADSDQLWTGPASSHSLRAPAAGDGQGTVGTDLSRRRRALPQEPRTLAPARPGVHSADISGPDVGAPSGNRWNPAVSLRRAAPVRL